MLSDLGFYSLMIFFFDMVKDFGEKPPARACFAAAGLPRNALVEIECYAIIDPRQGNYIYNHAPIVYRQ